MRFSTFLKEFPKQIPTSDLGDIEKKINISEKMAKQFCGDFPRLLIYRGKRGDRSYRCTCCDGVIQEAAHQRLMTDLESNLFSASHGERDVMCPLCMAPCKVVNAAKWNLLRHDEYRPVVFEYIPKAQKGELVCLFTYDVARSLYEGATGTVYQSFGAHCEDLFVLRSGGAAQYKYYRYSNTFHLVSSIVVKDGQKQMYGKGFQEPFISHTWSIANMRYDLKHHPDGLYRKDSFLKYVPGEISMILVLLWHIRRSFRPLRCSSRQSFTVRYRGCFIQEAFILSCITLRGAIVKRSFQSLPRRSSRLGIKVEAR